jgi:hypothetical protein
MKLNVFFPVMLAGLFAVCITQAAAIFSESRADSIPASKIFINTGFENASPMNWEVDSAGRVIGSLVYDHERFSANRAVNHFHFRVEAAAGTEVTIIPEKFRQHLEQHPREFALEAYAVRRFF